MDGIPIYDPTADDFSMNGRGLLFPSSCTVEWTRNGPWELDMEHPIGADMRWTLIGSECILKVPVLMRESPLYEGEAYDSGTATVTRKIYKVVTRGSRLRLRAKASTSAKILGAYAPGTEVVQLSDNGSGWYRVTVCKGGATGWMSASYLQFVKNVTETISAARPAPQSAIKVEPRREQLFRCSAPQPDTTDGVVKVSARHIFFDLCQNLIGGDYSPKNADIQTAAQRAFGMLMNEHPFELHVLATGSVTGDYGYRNFVDALTNDEDGMLKQAGADLVVDNYDIYILPKLDRDMGVTIRRGKNLNGVKVHYDDSAAVTRIVPQGRDKDGNPLRLSGTVYVDSPHIGDYAVIRARKIDYDVSVSDAKDSAFKTDAAARAELRRLAQADFSSGIDLPEYSLDIDFVQLQDTEAYPEYAALQAVHGYDVATVIDEEIGLTAKVGMSYYKENVLTEKYEDATLGDVKSVQQTVVGSSIAPGTVSGSKLIPGSVSGSMLRNQSIYYAQIALAAVEQLNANAITALRAHINELVAGSVTTDQLYADLAKIAVAQITTANIQNANIDWAQIAELSAQVAQIAKAQITTANINSANIDWAQIGTLSAQIGTIAEAKIKAAEITSAQISDLEAVMAEIFSASIGSADIGFAQIKDLVTDQAIIQEGVGGKLYIARLAVTEANMVSLTVGELVVKGSDGRFYAVSVDESGNVTTALKQIGNDDVEDVSINAGEKIIEGSVTAACLNAQDIFADNAIISNLIAANLDVAALFAREAFIAQLNTSDIRGNEYLKITVSELTEQITAAQGAADAAQQTANQNAADITTLTTRVGKAEVAIDAANAEIALRASKTEVTQQIAEVQASADGYAETLGGQIEAVQASADDAGAAAALAQQTANQNASSITTLTTRIGKAEVAIDAANAEIALRASKTEVTQQIAEVQASADGYAETLGGQIEAVQASADDAGAAAALAQQTANQNASSITALTTRVGKAEVAIDAANAEISLRASKTEVTQQIAEVQTEIAGKNTVWRQDAAPENAQAYDLWVQPSAGLTWQAIPAEEGLPVFQIDSDGVLSYEYPAGVTGPEYSIDENGYLVISDVPGFTVTMASDGMLTAWRLVQDAELRQAIEDNAESADEKITAVYTEVSVRQDAFDVQIQRKVDAEELQVYMRYDDAGKLELGRSDSRYVSQTSDSGFVVLQDGQPMTSIVRNAVSAPVLEARRMITAGNYSIRVGSNGGLIFN